MLLRSSSCFADKMLSGFTNPYTHNWRMKHPPGRRHENTPAQPQRSSISILAHWHIKLSYKLILNSLFFQYFLIYCGGKH